MAQAKNFISTNVYTGRYGPPSRTGTVLFSEVDIDESKTSWTNGQLLIIVDLSGSMTRAIPMMKASLLALWAAIQDSDDSDCVELTLIGYNTTAWVIYSPESDVGFEDSVERICAEGMTDMGAALELGFSLKNSSKCTWMLFLSDGCPTTGKYQTVESFEKLKETIPDNTNITTIGYGKDFDIAILENIGDHFIYIENMEQIPSVFGSLAHEVAASWGFNARFDISYTDPTRDSSNLANLRFIIGDNSIGSLYPGKKFTIGLLIEDIGLVNALKKSEIVLKFEWICAFTMTKESKTVEVIWNDEEPPKKYRAKYYSSCKGRRMHMLRTSKSVLFDCKKIREELNEWVEPCALVHREELLRIIDGFERSIRSGGDLRSMKYASAAGSFEARKQATYTSGTGMTSGQKEMVSKVRDKYLKVVPTGSGSSSRYTYHTPGGV